MLWAADERLTVAIFGLSLACNQPACCLFSLTAALNSSSFSFFELHKNVAGAWLTITRVYYSKGCANI